jgi:hypothetical protein
VLLRYLFVSLFYFVVEIEVVRHEETFSSSRYVFWEHTVMSRGMERPVWAGDALLSVSKVQWNVLGEVTETLCV